MSSFKEVRTYEVSAITRLDKLKEELLLLDVDKARTLVKTAQLDFEHRIRSLKRELKENKKARQATRETLGDCLEGQEHRKQLDEISRQDGMRLRRLKADRRKNLEPLKTFVEAKEKRQSRLRAERKRLSQDLQKRLHEAYICYAKEMGSGGLPQLNIIYSDEYLLVVDKAAGVLSVPGRRWRQQDSVTSRVALHFPQATGPLAVHRLDQATSGLMVVSLTEDAHCELSIQFQRRVIDKTYIANVSGRVESDSGTISFPMGANFLQRPRQMLDYENGKPSETKFRVLSRNDHHTRLELVPITGRTHQLRLHCASPEGLACPIVGDTLYGDPECSHRLHLHAAYLGFRHPFTGEFLEFSSGCSF